MARADEWRVRLMHEASCHEESSFLTLTFNDGNLPADYSVSVRDVQLFNKRLRKRMGKFRFFACGEYGESSYRPHYHLVVFGVGFSDRTPWRKSASGHVLYRSAELESLWPFGHCEIGSVTSESAGYVARYCLKKVTGKPAEQHYQRINPVTGVLGPVRPEFITMSTRPGIGAEWYAEFGSDAFPSDFLVLDGRKVPVPRYYAKKLHEADLFDVKLARIARALLHENNNTPDRLAVRETCAELKAERLTRELEQES